MLAGTGEVLQVACYKLVATAYFIYAYLTQPPAMSAARWVTFLQVKRSGTTADKVAAMSLLVSSSAAASLKSLDGLLGMMAKSGGGRQVVVAALEALQVGGWPSTD
jgi:hypothetical protein